MARRAPRLCLSLSIAVSVALALGPRVARADRSEPELLGDLKAAASAREQGLYSAAAKRLRALESSELAAGVGLLRARLLRADGELDAAAHAAEAAAATIPPAELRAHLYAELAGIYIERGELESADQAQRAAWDATRNLDYASKLVFELAQAYDTRGRAPQAFELYTRVWKSYPTTAASDAAFARAQALAVSLKAPPPESQALLARADKLRDAFRCEAALAHYEMVLARPETSAAERPRLERARADCLFDRRRYREAATAYDAIAARDKQDFEVRMQSARALARVGDRAASIAAFQKLERVRDPAVVAKARSLLAVVVFDKEPARAHSLMLKVERQTADADLAAQARWQLAWEDVKSGEWARALPRLDKLAEQPASDIEVQRARYWRAVARAQSPKPQVKSAGESQLGDLARDVPLSYYGMLASDRVGAPQIERSLAGPRVSSDEPPALRRARLFADGGFPEIAGDEIESFVDESRLGRDLRVSAARLLERAGDSHRGLRLVEDTFGATLDQGIDPSWREAWELAWPRAYGEWVSGAAHEFGFDPALVWAIMREESAYRPEVSSPAGALGLMQLIPPTASRVAGELGIAGFVPERLYDPETSIRLGTYYLRSLVDRFDGSRPLAIASYNAGPEAVDRWLDKDGATPNDVFVESVSYAETRRYLRRVLRSYRMYQLLYGDAVKPEPRPATAAQTQLRAGR
jgi:soluble lytic murein transglycosylase